MTITAVIPYRPSPERAAGFARVHAFLDRVADQMVVTDDDGDPFSRAASINAGVERADGDILIICDADLLCPIDQIDLAIIRIATNRAEVVLPFDRYRYLTATASNAVIRGDEPTEASKYQFEMTSSVGGICVIDRTAFDRVGGFDARFRGWGGEDYAFWSAANTLAGPVERVPGPLYHLWHPTDPVRPARNMALMGAYIDASGDPAAMRALIEERVTC